MTQLDRWGLHPEEKALIEKVRASVAERLGEEFADRWAKRLESNRRLLAVYMPDGMRTELDYLDRGPYPYEPSDFSDIRRGA